MNQDLWRIIIPVVMLIVWALSNLFNRENAAAKDRAMGLGPRPGFPPRPGERPGGSSMTSANRPTAKDDGIIILRSETTRPGARSTSPARRNQGRTRPASSSPRHPEPPPSRPKEILGGRISAEVNQTITRPLEIRPLTESVSAANELEAAATSTAPAVGYVAATSIADLRLALSTTARIREAFLLNEILQPPMARRRQRHRDRKI